LKIGLFYEELWDFTSKAIVAWSQMGSQTDMPVARQKVGIV
jgi:hypothetical protein